MPRGNLRIQRVEEAPDNDGGSRTLEPTPCQRYVCAPMDRDRRVQEWLFEGGYYAYLGGFLLAGFAGIALLAGFPVPLPGHPIILLVLAAALGFLIGRQVGRMVFGGADRSARSIYMPRGTSTPYATQYSHIDTLEARGDIAGAVGAWEKAAIAEPNNPWPLIRAGELYMRTLGEPATALDRFKAAREVVSISLDHRLYVTQKIVDLYLGPINEPGRALVELRRMVETFPDRREAQFARGAIARLKAQSTADPFTPP